jgi:hypothetical protein
VLAQLPRSPGTLILRLLGRGLTQSQALEDVRNLPGNAWQRPLLIQILVRLQFDLEVHGPDLSQEEREFMTNVRQSFEEYEEEVRLRGFRKGLEEGLEKGRQEGLSLSIRSLQAALVQIYRSRFGEVPPAIQARIDSTHELSTLQDWISGLGSAADAASAEQLLLQGPRTV